jgi:hypothetical protein
MWRSETVKLLYMLNLLPHNLRSKSKLLYVCHMQTFPECSDCMKSRSASAILQLSIQFFHGIPRRFAARIPVWSGVWPKYQRFEFASEVRCRRAHRPWPICVRAYLGRKLHAAFEINLRDLSGPRKMRCYYIRYAVIWVRPHSEIGFGIFPAHTMRKLLIRSTHWSIRLLLINWRHSHYMIVIAWEYIAFSAYFSTKRIHIRSYADMKIDLMFPFALNICMANIICEIIK